MHTTPDGFITSDDTRLIGHVARYINKKAPSTEAKVWHSGGGIFGVLLKIGDGREAFFGTVDDAWGAEVADADISRPI